MEENLFGVDMKDTRIARIGNICANLVVAAELRAQREGKTFWQSLREVAEDWQGVVTGEQNETSERRRRRA